MSDAKLQVRVDEREKILWERAAKERGMVFSEFVREAVNLMAGLDRSFMQKVIEISETSGIAKSFVIEADAIETWAEQDAEKIVWGPMPGPVSRYMLELDANGVLKPVRGTELYNRLLDNKIRHKERQRAEQLRAELAMGGTLSTEDSEWLETLNRKILVNKAVKDMNELKKRHNQE